MTLLKAKRPEKQRAKHVREVTEEIWKNLHMKLQDHSRSWFNDFVQAKCIKCGKSDERMMRVYALFFCRYCFLQEFDYTAKQLPKRIYRKWKAKYWLQLKLEGKVPWKKMENIGGAKCDSDEEKKVKNYMRVKRDKPAIFGD